MRKLGGQLLIFMKCLCRGKALKSEFSPPAGNFSANYEKYCVQMDKEDGLVNNRINWLLTSQSILFAALGLGEGIAGPSVREAVVTVVPAVGFFSSLFIWLSIIGAIRSFCRYRYLLLKVCPEACDKDHEFPQLHRDLLNITLGFISPMVVPILLFIAWGWLFWYL